VTYTQPRVFLSFREIAALAPDAGLQLTYCQSHDSFFLDPELDDEQDQMQRVEYYAEWKESVERNPEGNVNSPPFADAVRIAEPEQWYRKAKHAARS